MEISVKSNIKEFTKQLDYFQKQQIPYATSRALNDVAVDAQTDVVQGIENKFDNKKKWWLKQQPTGVKVKFSKKTFLKASVYTDAYFAKIQEKGGVKTPKTAKNLAIPTKFVARKYRTSRGAKEMIDERNNVFATSKGVFRRTGKKRYPIQLLWSLARAAAVKPRLQFYETVKRAVVKNFEKRFKDRLEQALKTAKTK